MNKTTAIERLKVISAIETGDEARYSAEDVLCSFLEALGYADVVEAYAQIQKASG